MPRAVLKSDKTTTIRVNDVIVTNSPGAKDKTAIKATICKIRAVVDPPGSPMSKVRVWAQLGSIATRLKNKIKAIINKWLIFLQNRVALSNFTCQYFKC